MRKYLRIPIFIIVLVLTYGCGLIFSDTQQTGNDFQKKEKIFRKVIESQAKVKNAKKNYQSIAYGQMTIYKPESFLALDSLYSLKQEYLNKRDSRGLKESGIEEAIPGYKASADAEIHLVEYEIEHIYQITEKDIIQIHHDYYMFDYENNLISVTPFYNYEIFKKHQNFYYAYEFESHFVDNRELTISTQERNFLRFFKEQAYFLIGEEELTPFMQHTMNIMEVAFKAGTIDFTEITKWIVIEEFGKKEKPLTIEKIGKLLSYTQDGELIEYELNVEWLDEEEDVLKTTKFIFSPYLEIKDQITDLMR